MALILMLSARGVYHLSLGSILLFCAAHELHLSREREVLLRNRRGYFDSLVKMFFIFLPLGSVSWSEYFIRLRGDWRILKESINVLICLSGVHGRYCFLACLSVSYLVRTILFRVLCRSLSIQGRIQGALIFNDGSIKSRDMLYFSSLKQKHVLIFINRLADLVERRTLVCLEIFVIAHPTF